MKVNSKCWKMKYFWKKMVQFRVSVHSSWCVYVYLIWLRLLSELTILWFFLTFQLFWTRKTILTKPRTFFFRWKIWHWKENIYIIWCENCKKIVAFPSPKPYTAKYIPNENLHYTQNFEWFCERLRKLINRNLLCKY